MAFSTTLRGERFAFADLRDVMAKANEEKSGDMLAGLAARSERERVAAKLVLAEITLGDFLAHPLIDDDVTQAILASHDAVGFASLRHLSVGQFRELLLDDSRDIAALAPLVTPEMAAAVTKLMSNKDLVLASNRIRRVTRCRNTLGQPGVLACRIQPNHPSDDLGAILLAVIDGLLYGCGDAVIGVNPATESVETVAAILRGLNRLIETLAVPTQACCLAHISTQLSAMDRGAPVDLLFQSVAGTQAANASFGISLAMLQEGLERTREHHRQRDGCWVGDNVMYFETGQGSALSAEAHQGIDQLTLEARAYGVARLFEPHLVNDVVGFIGPEYLANERQIIRAGLEDQFMGKLLGLPMGCDVCYTNHVDADQNSADNLLLLLATAGCNYFMGVPCADDVMLNYQSTSYHDVAGVRRLLNLRPAPEFAAWLEDRGIFERGQLAGPDSSRRDTLIHRTAAALLP